MIEFFGPLNYLYHWIRREIVYENDGSFFVLAQSLKSAFSGAPGAFWGFNQGLLKMKSFAIGFVMKLSTSRME